MTPHSNNGDSSLKWTEPHLKPRDSGHTGVRSWNIPFLRLNVWKSSYSNFCSNLSKCSPAKQSNQLLRWRQQFTHFQNNSSILPGSVSHVPHYSRELREKGGGQKVKVLDKRYDTQMFAVCSNSFIRGSWTPKGNYSHVMSMQKTSRDVIGITIIVPVSVMMQ